MQIKTNFQQKIEGHKWAVFRLTKHFVLALPGLCTLNIFEYEISLSCGKFRNHHREPLFGHGNTFDRGRPVANQRTSKKQFTLNTCSCLKLESPTPQILYVYLWDTPMLSRYYGDTLEWWGCVKLYTLHNHSNSDFAIWKIRRIFLFERFVLEFPRIDTSDFKIFRGLIFSEVLTDICEASLKFLGWLRLAFSYFSH